MMRFPPSFRLPVPLDPESVLHPIPTSFVSMTLGPHLGLDCPPLPSCVELVAGHATHMRRPFPLLDGMTILAMHTPRCLALLLFAIAHARVRSGVCAPRSTCSTSFSSPALSSASPIVCLLACLLACVHACNVRRHLAVALAPHPLPASSAAAVSAIARLVPTLSTVVVAIVLHSLAANLSTCVRRCGVALLVLRPPSVFLSSPSPCPDSSCSKALRLTSGKATVGRFLELSARQSCCRTRLPLPPWPSCAFCSLHGVRRIVSAFAQSIVPLLGCMKPLDSFKGHVP